MRAITDTDILSRLAFDNPWWRIAGGGEARLHSPPKRAFFEPFLDAVLDGDDGRPLIVAGPLRAGKTVMIRQAVAALMERGTAPESIVYCCWATAGYGGADPAGICRQFAAQHGHGPETPLFVFFDELQYVADWPRALAALAREFPAASITGAVSAMAPALVSGAKTDPAGVRLMVLPPLSFAEFLRLRGTEAAIFTGGETGGALSITQSALAGLNDEFTHYINFGGFPEGVPIARPEPPPPNFVRDGLSERVLRRDLAAIAGISDPGELIRLFALLAANTAQEVSMEELAKAVGIAKNTVRKYLDHLEHAFLIRRLPRVDRQAKRFQRAVAFKVHLSAPCLHAALFGPVGPDDAAYARLAETAVVGQWLGAPAMADVAYASWRGGGIDLLTIDPASKRPDHVYEIDWTAAYEPGGAKADKGPKDLTQFAESTGRGAKAYVLTRRAAYAASVGGVPVTMAPVSLYAYWLGRDPLMRRFHGGNE